MKLGPLPIILTISLFVCAGASNTYAAGYYQWLDDRGVPQYTERPPTDRPYTFISTKAGTKKTAQRSTESGGGLRVPESVDEGMPEIQAQKQKARDLMDVHC